MGKGSVAPGDEVIEMGLVKLYRITGKKEYLETAKFFIEARGQYNGYDPKSKDPMKNGSYWQDDKPVAQQSEAVGHAVRAGYLYSAVADVAALTEDDIASSNLILWGDPTSNAVIRKIVDQLPIRWVGDQVVAGDRKFDAANHIPVLIYPNPLNPKRYVVLNSGVTFRAMDDSSNALQVPKLPDWAILDARTEPGKVSAGQVVAADFFGERWELLPARPE